MYIVPIAIRIKSTCNQLAVRLPHQNGHRMVMHSLRLILIFHWTVSA